MVCKELQVSHALDIFQNYEDQILRRKSKEKDRRRGKKMRKCVFSGVYR